MSPGGFVDPNDLQRQIEEMTGDAPAEPSAPTDPPAPAATDLPEEPPALEGPASEPAVPSGEVPQETPEEEPSDDGLIHLPDGSTIPVDRLRELMAIDTTFRLNPRVEETVRRAIEGNGMFAPPAAATPPATPPSYTYGPPVAQPAPPSSLSAPAAPAGLPADVDLEDPTVRFLYGEYQRLHETIAQQNEMLARQAQAQQVSGVTRAKQDLHQKYPNLTIEDVAALDAVATNRGLGTHFWHMYGDPYRAALEAMETAALTMPGVHQKMTSAPAGTTPIDPSRAKKQQQLNALAGKGGTAPRTEPPRKLTPSERIQAMAAEIQASQQA